MGAPPIVLWTDPPDMEILNELSPTQMREIIIAHAKYYAGEKALNEELTAAVKRIVNANK